MKIKYIIPFACASMLTISCIDDMDVQPLDKNVVTDEVAYADEASYYKGLLKVYSILAISGQNGVGSTDISGLDAGNSQLLRSLFNLQEVSTDEAKCAWGDNWAKEINTCTWSDVKNESIEGVYQRSMFIVALANEFITQVDKRSVSDKVKGYREEARFVRALAYYFLIDCYGNPPFITESNYSLQPSQVSRAELFAWIESELKDLTTTLPATNEYGRSTKYAAYALLSRLYLNAEVYAGEKRYKDCVEASKMVIEGPFSLAQNYQHLFMGDNNNNGAQTECIFPIVFDGVATQTYGGTTYLILSSRSDDENDESVTGVGTGWGGNRSTAVLVKKFEFADNNAPTAATIKDKRGIFFDENRKMEMSILKDGFKTDGWAVYKFNNMYVNGGVIGKNKTFCDTDFILFRLGEIYLNYAEAVVRGSSEGTKAQAVEYINNLRERGYGDTSGNITEADLTLDFMLDERSREMYWECTRRSDLIRFDKFTSGSYTWEWKNDVAQGAGLDAKYNLYPLPITDLSVNSNLKQNEGY